MNSIAIIPAYDPGPVVAEVLNLTLQQVDSVLLINDGSDVENTERLRALASADGRVTLLEHPHNKGKGFAINSGLEYALEHQFSDIVMLDSDGQHNPAHIQSLLQLAHSNRSDLVLGVRSESRQMPLRSRIGNAAMRWLFKLMYRTPVRDTQTGFRYVSPDFARFAMSRIRPGRYETEMKMLMLAAKSGCRIDQVGIDTVYIDGNKNSKFRPLNDSLRVLRAMVLYSGVGLLSFVLDYGLYLLLIGLFGSHFLLAHVVSRLCSASFNFTANKRFVFRNRASWLGSAGRYLLAMGLSLMLSSALLTALVQYTSISAVLGKPLAEAGTFVVNFFVLRHFVFK